MKKSDGKQDRAMRDYIVNGGVEGVLIIRQGQRIPDAVMRRWGDALKLDGVVPAADTTEDKK